MIDYLITSRIQVIAIVGSLILFLFIVEMVRKQNLKEEYSLLWILWALVFLVLSIWREGLHIFAALVGIEYPPAALVLLFIVGIIFILIQFSIVISKNMEQIKNLAQELALLREKVEKPKDSSGDR